MAFSNTINAQFIVVIKDWMLIYESVRVLLPLLVWNLFFKKTSTNNMNRTGIHNQRRIKRREKDRERRRRRKKHIADVMLLSLYRLFHLVLYLCVFFFVSYSNYPDFDHRAEDNEQRMSRMKNCQISPAVHGIQRQVYHTMESILYLCVQQKSFRIKQRSQFWRNSIRSFLAFQAYRFSM